ncbi:MAG: 16S rRNA (guanine(966)-N(2))-methyltransferase RsmD [Magnetococcales bacterium]|nr:16S rRNA (guanine(966)-N(2))-methyltransferase RsmD [Magnetococcales bacterium]
MVRITGGSLRGMRIPVPHTLQTRPTTDRVREALFSILGEACDGASVLDLFAGSGILGFEALSRGGRQACFVDNSREVTRQLQSSAGQLKLADRVAVLQAGLEEKRVWESTVRKMTLQMGWNRAFNLVFLDPPYGQGWVPRILSSLRTGDCLAEGALLVAEQERGAGLLTGLEGWELLNSRCYGGTELVFLKHRGSGRAVGREDSGTASPDA